MGRSLTQRVLSRLPGIHAGDDPDGLTQAELRRAVVALRDEHGLSPGEIAMCLPRNRSEVVALYREHSTSRGADHSAE